MSLQNVKRWSVNAISEGQAPLALFCDGRPLTQSAPATVDDVSPVQYLLISIASCFALSCRAVLGRRRLTRASFEVVAVAEKAASVIDNRLSGISVVAIFGDGITEADAALIAEQAKPLCTVTNTVLDSPAIRYGTRAVKQYRTGIHDHPPQHAAH